jgi:biopolymer transport protein ExbD
MNIKPICLIALVLSACSSNTPWQSYDDVERAAGTPEHVVRVNRDGALTLDGKDKSPDELTAFFKEAAGKEQSSYIYVVAADNVQREKLWAAQSMIEATGVCAKSWCMDGYEEAAAAVESAKPN